MSIIRITVRTFQNEQHAEMFIAMAQKIDETSKKDGFKINFTMIQNQTLKNQSKVLGLKIDNSITSYLESTIVSIDGIRDRLKIKHFIHNMPAFDSKKLRAFIVDNEPGINMSHSLTCESCGASSDVSLPITSEFFWPNT